MVRRGKPSRLRRGIDRAKIALGGSPRSYHYALEARYHVDLFIRDASERLDRKVPCRLVSVIAGLLAMSFPETWAPSIFLRSNFTSRNETAIDFFKFALARIPDDPPQAAMKVFVRETIELMERTPFTNRSARAAIMGSGALRQAPS